MSISSTREYRRSVVLILVGGALLSLLGIGIRLIDHADSLQIVFYRSIAQAGVLLSAVFWLNRRDIKRPLLNLGAKGVTASITLGAAGLFMILSIRHTTVANAVVVIALAPLCSALLGWWWLREHVSTLTRQAMLIAFVGIVLVCWEGLNSGGLLGIGYAFVMMTLYSISLVILRSQRQADMLLVCGLSGVVLAVGVAPWLSSFTVSAGDLLICTLLGVFQIGLGMVLITKGTAHVPAAQVSLLALSEVVLSPLWVWLFVDETPGLLSLVGGAIVLFAISWQALKGGKRTV